MRSFGVGIGPIAVLASGLVVTADPYLRVRATVELRDSSAPRKPLLSLQLSEDGDWLAVAPDRSFEASKEAKVARLSFYENRLLPLARPAPPSNGALFEALARHPAKALRAATVDDDRPASVVAGPTTPRPSPILDKMRTLPVDGLGSPRIRTSKPHKPSAKAMLAHQQAMAVLARAKLTGRRRDFALAEQTWASAAEADPSWSWPFYNLACVAALTGQPEDALSYLLEVAARESTIEMSSRIRSDADLNALQGRAELQALRSMMEIYARKDEDAAQPAK